MKKMTLALVVMSVVAGIGFTSCSPKMHENMMAKGPAAAAAPTPLNTASLVPFSRAKMQQLVRNGVDLTQIQFYIDQKVILRRMDGSSAREVVRKGEIVSESAHSASEVVLPEFTPVVCDRVMGDTLMISFETQNNDIPFVALYGGNTFSVLGTNWINGSADVNYDNQTYRIICGSCGNVAEVRLMVKETNVDKATNAGKTVVGRKLYK